MWLNDVIDLEDYQMEHANLEDDQTDIVNMEDDQMIKHNDTCSSNKKSLKTMLKNLLKKKKSRRSGSRSGSDKSTYSTTEFRMGVRAMMSLSRETSLRAVKEREIRHAKAMAEAASLRMIFRNNVQESMDCDIMGLYDN